MGNQRVAVNQHQKPTEGYRGVLVYQQEQGYKFITMMINLCTPDERSRVTSYDYEIDLPEEAEHLPAGSLLASVDLYHFPATHGMEIELTIRSQAGEDTARYIVNAAGIEERSSFLWLDVIKARDSLRKRHTLSADRDYDVRS